MKRLLVYSLVVALPLISIQMGAHAHPAKSPVMQRSVYSSTFSYSAPLSTYQRCSEHSDIGRYVSESAFDDAMDECQADLNVDCVRVSTKVTEEISSEFIGYKKCIAKSRVHGYSVK